MNSRSRTRWPNRSVSALFLSLLFLLAASVGTAVSSDVPIATVPVGDAPVAVAVNPVAHHVYVANYNAGTVSVIDGVSDTVTATITMPIRLTAAFPVAVVVDPLAAAPTAYVANFWSGMLSAIDEGSLSQTYTVDLGSTHAGGPRALALDPTSTPPRLYVANYGDGTVSLYDASSGTFIKDLAVDGPRPRALGIYVSPTRERVFVANRDNASVTIIDAATDTVLKTVAVGAAPRSIAVDPGTGYAYVSNNASDSVSVIDANDEVTATVPVGDGPTGLAVDSAGGRVFIANYNSGNVTVLKTTGNSIEGTVTVGANPYAVAFDVGDQKAFVSNYGSSSASVINSALSVTNVATGYRPYALAVNEGISPHKTYVGNWGDDTVTVIDEPAPLAAWPLAPSTAFAAAGDPPIDLDIDLAPGGTLPVDDQVITGTATSMRAVPSGIAAVFYQFDDDTRWRRGAVLTGAGTPSATWAVEPEIPLAAGPHSFRVIAFDQAGAVSCTSDFGATVGGGTLGGSASLEFSLTEQGQPPAAGAGGPYLGFEGVAVDLDGSGSVDSDGAIVSWEWDLDDDGDFDDATGEKPAATFADDYAGTVGLRVTDNDGLHAEARSAIEVRNVAPTLGPVIVPPVPTQLGGGTSVSIGFSDAGVLDTHSATWDWGDGTMSPGMVVEAGGTGTAYGSHVYAEAGVYAVTIVVADDDGGAVSAIASEYVVVYDPAGGFVTGGGWIDSPPGAYVAAPELFGKASFGFVSKYKKGASLPQGSAQFAFHAAGFNFKSTALEWLVVANDRAKFKGSGVVNGAGGYGFMITAIDGDPKRAPDAFRIKVWDKGTGLVVYDNQLGESETAYSATVLGGGSIVVHRK